ncbi:MULTISPECIES: EamA family transporter [unclassified Pseudomonas]|jgi:drug/metabolite transporter (DMT)-like permease|uniref:EamA family transporter n=1 Tax=unclassified Pseudomonas TaxID=196821 RepID=UPI00103C494D|nr:MULTISPECIES: EamA family transporter [unclassified Pseudomonas]MBB6288837.1 drug/metabolite transporter (DMT)-like permease [Pseudomonas sp. SJZ073]MBB6313809.1 drug/metabolite transporter (DMT)-like permease [Pseudomonas sp. JAI120]MCS4309760.1 drug/metabolite transporter (DMT)-like permease [Pseudomonas sp. BIGb0381]NJJ55124.1 EamA family transporter [Pseudomonas sp. B14(2022)]
MSLDVFAIIMLGAALHATWNAVVKGGDNKLLTTCMIASIASLIASAVIPFLELPSKESWPFIGASVILQVVYFVLVASTYRIADMSQTYPIMRGTAPLLVATASVGLLSESLSSFAWLGIAIICIGILSMAATPGIGQRKGLLLALVNAAVIAGYTLIDGVGVRKSGAPAAYTLWIFLLTGIALALWACAVRRREFWRYLARHWRPGVIGGFGTVVSYGLALWAMTAAPIATVSALRETSILFGVVISALVLKEQLTRRRIMAACIIAGGAMVLRLG